ncbi:MAG TPA: thiol:disulfide interchange protein DsbG [Steroidobacteraceae bacterium]|nr:thiol:disulfide interchange protein DsbG [Steroidobacteraceae bacterium]
MQIRIRSMFVLAAAFSMQAAFAADPAQSKAADKPAVIKNIEKQGVEIFGQFDAPGGLRGFAGAAGQHPLAIYLTPDGEHAVVGTLIDAEGADVNASVLQSMVLKPMSQRLWAKLEKSTWVQDGDPKAARIVYTFMDPNCPYCHRFWQAARRWVQAGKVQLRHILVGVIREDSANKAAAIMTAASPAEAFALHEQQQAQGGVKALAVIPQDAKAQLDANERLMTELGIQGTPGILYLDDAGVVQTAAGMPQPEDMDTVLGPH